MHWLQIFALKYHTPIELVRKTKMLSFIFKPNLHEFAEVISLGNGFGLGKKIKTDYNDS